MHLGRQAFKHARVSLFNKLYFFIVAFTFLKNDCQGFSTNILSMLTPMAKALKESLRRDMNLKISLLDTMEKMLQSEKVATKVFSSPMYQKSKRVGIYLSMDDEVNTKQIIRHIFDSGKQCYVPSYNKNEMKLFKMLSLKDIENLSSNKHKILQPSMDSGLEEALDTGIDLVITPGRAFSRQGERLGRGKGYYDKYLSTLKEKYPDVKFMGIAFSTQIVEKIPVDEYDVILDQVVQPDR